jgi:hypothetical protein
VKGSTAKLRDEFKRMAAILQRERDFHHNFREIGEWGSSITLGR